MSQRKGGLAEQPSQETIKGLMNMARQHESFIKGGANDWPKIDWKAAHERERAREQTRNQAARLSHLTVEVGETKLTMSRRGEASGSPTEAHFLVLHPERVHVTQRLKDHLREAIPKVMGDCFRLEPNYQDYSAREMGDPTTWIIHVVGLSSDPMARQRLMRAGALLNGSIEQAGFLVKG